jgi:metallophosphoesterase (TIGR00282 family)
VRVLFLGDVFGEAGRRAVSRLVPSLQADEAIDLTVVNAENAAAGSGLTPANARELLQHAQALTSGNHIWSKREIIPVLEADDLPILRPLNYPPPAPGRGFRVIERDGHRLGIVNVEGRTFMKPLDDPFRAVDEAISALKTQGVASILVDFHAEATAEKWAFAHHCDGRVSAVIGTHTHVQTADERVLKGGTAFLTDAGMCGPFESIIGMGIDGALMRFRTQRFAQYVPAERDVWLQGAIVDIDDATGRARSIKRVRRHLDD